MSPVLVKALEEHRSRQQIQYRLQAGARWKDFGLVFAQRNGGPINASNLRNRHRYPLLRRAGLRRVTTDLCVHGRNRKKKEAVSAMDSLLTAPGHESDLG